MRFQVSASHSGRGASMELHQLTAAVGAVGISQMLDGKIWQGVLLGIAGVASATLGDLVESVADAPVESAAEYRFRVRDVPVGGTVRLGLARADRDRHRRPAR